MTRNDDDAMIVAPDFSKHGPAGTVAVTVPAAVTDPDRLAALDSYRILDTPAEPGFDDVVQLACRLCEAPVALVSLVAGDRQWFKARRGFPACETDLNSSVCAHALATPDQVLVIPDLATDTRTDRNPLVTGNPHIRFYAGAPLVTPSGQVLGSLCVIDHAPRPKGLKSSQLQDLQALARQVVAQLELRRAFMAKDALWAEERRSFRAREALHRTQELVGHQQPDLNAILRTVLDGAMRAVPQADGGVVELIDGDRLEYHVTAGSLAAHQGLQLPIGSSVAGRVVRTRQAYRFDDAKLEEDLNQETATKIGLVSAILAPIIQGDSVLGVLKLQSAVPNAFQAGDLDQLSLFAGVASAGLSTAEAQALTRARDIYWRGLFDRLDEGFLLGEAIRDASGRITDWRYLDVNPAWSRLIGLDPKKVIGRSVREVVPDVEEAWIADFAAVVETGRGATFTRQVGALGRWYEGRAFKLDGDRFGVIFLEVTERVEADARRLALISLSDGLRDASDTGAITRMAAEIVGRTLQTTRAGFGRVDTDVEMIEIEPDWTAPGVTSIAGRHRFADYGDLTRELIGGEPLIIDDVDTDARTRRNPSVMHRVGIRSLINMPVKDKGRTVAVFIVHDDKARHWTEEEIGFLRNVAERVEYGVERVRAEDRQQVLNHELAHRLKNTLAVVQSIASQTLKDVTERPLVEVFERRVLALSRAHDVLMQKSWSAARMRNIMAGVLTIQADLDRFAFEGPDMDINPQAALSLSLLLHELATNALKYGALSADQGKVNVRWRTEDSQQPILILDWQESGGPSVEAPDDRRGFGSKLIHMGLMGTRNASLHYEPGGLRAQFRAPLRDIVEESQHA